MNFKTQTRLFLVVMLALPALLWWLHPVAGATAAPGCLLGFVMVAIGCWDAWRPGAP